MPNEWGYTPRHFRPHILDKNDPGVKDPYEELHRKENIHTDNKFLNRLKKYHACIPPYESQFKKKVISPEIKNLSEEEESIFNIYKLFDLTNPNN